MCVWVTWEFKWGLVCNYWCLYKGISRLALVVVICIRWFLKQLIKMFEGIMAERSNVATQQILDSMTVLLETLVKVRLNISCNDCWFHLWIFLFFIFFLFALFDWCFCKSLNLLPFHPFFSFLSVSFFNYDNFLT